jgi:Zn-dependent M28 family amino/carboxypeptidase
MPISLLPGGARRSALPLLAAAMLAACGGGDATPPTETAQAAPALRCDQRPNDTFAKVMECVTLANVREHQAALQAIADANGGTRAANTAGYARSVDYVREKMEAAGYAVTLHAFPFNFQAPAKLDRLSPAPRSIDTRMLTGSPAGDVTGMLVAIDLQLGLGNTSSSGCEAADFAGFPAGAIALMQRGGCSFAIKATNAQAAGAAAAVIFNQGDTTAQDRQNVFLGTLLPPPAPVLIPVVSTSYADGVEMSVIFGSTVRVQTFGVVQVTQHNVLAESKGGDPNSVVMVGAHLDSVVAGPGINDNGSGSAAILEVAKQLARIKPRNKLRFAWWGAEESGLVGSTAYVNSLPESEQAKIALYLNFDMVGSPNHVFFIYDGDNSDGVGSPAGPAGSEQIEETFERFFMQQNVPFKGTDFSGRSDYGPFIAVGIPSGGLFTGAEGIKTAEEAATFGGTAGEQYDPCYHLACDTFANNSNRALDVNSDAIAYATLQYAMNASDVTGAKGKGNFKVKVPFPPPPAM